MQGRLIALFTSDAQVIMQATSVLPLIALVMVSSSPLHMTMPSCCRAQGTAVHKERHYIQPDLCSSQPSTWITEHMIGLIQGACIKQYHNLLCSLFYHSLPCPSTHNVFHGAHNHDAAMLCWRSCFRRSVCLWRNDPVSMPTSRYSDCVALCSPLLLLLQPWKEPC